MTGKMKMNIMKKMNMIFDFHLGKKRAVIIFAFFSMLILKQFVIIYKGINKKMMTGMRKVCHQLRYKQARNSYKT
jgi:hypothetical protein